MERREITALDLILRPNRSAVVSEALREYRARELDRTLETAYREDREDSAALCTEWAVADAEDQE